MGRADPPKTVEIQATLGRMIDRGFEPDRHTYSYIICAYMEAISLEPGRLDSVLDFLTSAVISCDILLYNNLLKAYTSRGSVDTEQCECASFLQENCQRRTPSG